MRKLRTTHLILLALMVSLAGAGQLDAQNRGDGLSGTRTFDAQPGGTLVFDLRDGGSINVEGWDRNEIQISYYDRRNDAEDLEISFEPTRNGLEVTAEYTRRVRSNNLILEIRAPRSFNIRTESSGGDITLSNLEGTFSGRTAGGAINLHDVRGEANLTSGGGGIQITDSELDGRVRTGGGEALVENVIGDVRATSGGGNVQYRNVRSSTRVQRTPSDLCDADITEATVLITNAGGGIRLREAPEGACVRTGGGDIDIRGGQRFIHAYTGGGDIEIDTESGDVSARTGAGEIDVTFERAAGGGEIVLITGLGDVTLFVPQGFSAEFDLSLGYTRNSRQDFEIISDLELNQERTDRWDSSRGSPRKFIYGTGRTGSGDYRVNIRTTNGNITIRER